MFIFFIGYLYVILMFAAGTGQLLTGSIIFLCLGVLPAWLALTLWRRKQIQRILKKRQ